MKTALILLAFLLVLFILFILKFNSIRKNYRMLNDLLAFYNLYPEIFEKHISLEDIAMHLKNESHIKIEILRIEISKSINFEVTSSEELIAIYIEKCREVLTKLRHQGILDSGKYLLIKKYLKLEKVKNELFQKTRQN